MSLGRRHKDPGAEEVSMAETATVLVIDDDRDFNTSVRAFLESQGYTVIEATSGHEGLAKLAERKPDVIILDIMMESLTEGYSVSAAIKHQPAYKDCRNIPIVMVSSIQKSPDERFPFSGDVGMIRPDRYLTKPIDFTKLLEILKTVVVR